AAVYTVTLPKADQVVDPFHAVQLANRCLDAVRRRVQSEQTGHYAGDLVKSSASGLCQPT
ncbi:MAG: transposase, partial [Acidimicrobiales bacterium]